MLNIKTTSTFLILILVAGMGFGGAAMATSNTSSGFRLDNFDVENFGSNPFTPSDISLDAFFSLIGNEAFFSLYGQETFYSLFNQELFFSLYENEVFFSLYENEAFFSLYQPEIFFSLFNEDTFFSLITQESFFSLYDQEAFFSLYQSESFFSLFNEETFFSLYEDNSFFSLFDSEIFFSLFGEEGFFSLFNEEAFFSLFQASVFFSLFQFNTFFSLIFNSSNMSPETFFSLFGQETFFSLFNQLVFYSLFQSTLFFSLSDFDVQTFFSLFTQDIFFSLPFFSLPFFSLPFFSLPFFSLPFFSLPFFSLPFFSLPFFSLPFFSLPFFSLPFFSLPFFSLPFFSLPFFSLPFFSLDKVELKKMKDTMSKKEYRKLKRDVKKLRKIFYKLKKLQKIVFRYVKKLTRILDPELTWNIASLFPNGYDDSISKESVKIAVLDTGIDDSHPELSKAVTWTYDTTGEGHYDYNGHGTHVAGIIAASHDGTGITGIAPNVELYSIKVIAESTGEGEWEWLEEAIYLAVAGPDQIIGTSDDTDIINMSFGSGNEVPPNYIHEAIKFAYNHGVTLIAAGGNAGDGSLETNEINWPAAYDEVIAVSASSLTGNLASFSSSGDYIEVAAPGDLIYSTYLNDEYILWGGTSMATPHVTGIVALILSQYGSLPVGTFYDFNPNTVRGLLHMYSNDAGATGWDSGFGYGIVQYLN